MYAGPVYDDDSVHLADRLRDATAGESCKHLYRSSISTYERRPNRPRSNMLLPLHASASLYQLLQRAYSLGLPKSRHAPYSPAATLAADWLRTRRAAVAPDEQEPAAAAETWRVLRALNADERRADERAQAARRELLDAMTNAVERT